MNKRVKYIVGALILAMVIFPKSLFIPFVNTDTIINKIGCRLFELSSIRVITDTNLDLGKIQIKIGKQVVFSNGQQRNRIGQEYGHTLLDVFYDNLLIAEIGHFKRNNWYTNG